VNVNTPPIALPTRASDSLDSKTEGPTDWNLGFNYTLYSAVLLSCYWPRSCGVSVQNNSTIAAKTKARLSSSVYARHLTSAAVDSDWTVVDVASPHVKNLLVLKTGVSASPKVAVLVHKCLNGHAPSYLADDCRWIRQRRAGLRLSSDMMKLDVPPTRTTFGDRSFAVNGPRVWNYSLPASIRDPSLSLTVFRNSLNTHLFVK